MLLHQIDITKASRDYYYISFMFNQEIIDNIKKLEKREWDSELKKWKLDVYNLYKLISFYKGRKDIFFQFESDESRAEFIKKYSKKEVEYNNKEQAKAERLALHERIKLLKKTLLSQDTIDFDYSKFLKKGVVPRNYQTVGAILGNELGSMLLTADIGTGKTIISLLTAESRSANKVLVIVPNSLKFNWCQEILKFTNSKYFVLDSNKSREKKVNQFSIEEAKYIICNYEYFNASKFDFNNRIKKYGLTKFDLLICDESHRIKNPKANTTKNMHKHIKPIINNVLLLTGTPISSKLEDLYSQLNFISPEEFPSKNKFFIEYCGLVYDPNSYSNWAVASGPKLEEIHNKLDGMQYRIKKRDVIKDLPKVSINKVYLEMTDAEEKTYQDIESGFRNIDWSKETSISDKKEHGKELSALTILTKLRQYTSILKLEKAKELISELNDNNEKVVIFDVYKNPLQILTEEFKNNSALYTGDVQAFERQQLVNKFQEKDSDLQNLFLTLASGNYGITLTEASNMLIISQDWIPGTTDQAIGRIDRIGQVNSCNVYIFLYKDTVDIDVDTLLTEKKKTISKVVDGEDFVDNSESSVLSELMNKYKNKYR